MSNTIKEFDNKESYLNGNSEDCDEEVLLKGSELEKLASALRDDVEVFTPEKWIQGEIPPVHSEPPSGEVPEFLALKELILSSGLMLEEDMCLLMDSCPYLASFPMDKQGQAIRMDCVLLCGSCIAVAYSCYRFITQYKWPAVLMLFSSIGTTLFLTYKIYQLASLKKTLMNVLSGMTDLCSFTKKTTVSLKESYVVVNSKLILASFRRTNPEVVDRYYSHVQSEIVGNIQLYMKFLITVIKITRDATRVILSTWNPHYSSKAFFVALCSDDEFDLPNADDIAFNELSILKLEELNSLFVVLQSEYLRALGTSFCLAKKSDHQKLHLLLEKYSKMISEHLAAAKRNFCGRMYSEYADKKPALCAEARSMMVVQLDTMLSSLLFEVSSVKCFLQEKTDISSADKPYLEFSVKNIETAMLDCSHVFNQVFTLLGKNTEDAMLSLAGDIVQTPSDLSTAIEIGRSDFSLSDEDRVYFGMTDRDDGLPELYPELEPEESTPTYPRSLMFELKGVLEEKRMEFKQRESDAVTKSALTEVEQQFDLVVLNKPLTDQSDPARTEEDLSTDMVTLPRKRRQAQLENKRDGEAQPSVSFQPDLGLTKSVATSAALTSMMWNRPDEECFGDEGNDSSDENAN